MSNYTATYYNAAGRVFPASIFVSSVTITIRYLDENNVEKDIYWLEKDLLSFDEQVTGTELKYQNKEGAIERLVIRDAVLVQEIKKSLRHNRLFGKVHHRALNSITSKFLLVTAIILGILLLGYFWFVPWLGERVAKNFSKEYEIKLGEQMYSSIASTYKIDTRKTETVNAFYQQLHYAVDYPVKITVVESGEINAFAIPGGHIVVYDAILEKMKTPEELAALLDHEASHIQLRHSLRNLFRSLARKMFLALVFGNESGIVSVVVDNADELKGLSYSRSLETEADDNGLQLMAKSDIDVQGMVRLMELLQKASSGREPAEFLNTHPVAANRIENIQEKIKQLPAETPTDNTQLKKLFHAIYESY